MTLEITASHLITIAAAFTGVLWGLVKVIAAQQAKTIKDRFDGLASQLKDITGEIRRDREATQHLERQLMELKAELPRDYVRRDDFVRAISTIETRIDNMALRVERALLKQGGAE